MNFELCTDFLKHPITVAAVQSILFTVIGYFLVERWQRWRQRRDFQYKVLGKFGELSEDLYHRLSYLFVSRNNLPADMKLRMDYLNARGPFLALDGELFAACENEQILGRFFKLVRAAQELYKMACEKPSTTDAEFQAMQKYYRAQRKAVQTLMVREMRFITSKEAKDTVKGEDEKGKLPTSLTIPEEHEMHADS